MTPKPLINHSFTWLNPTSSIPIARVITDVYAGKLHPRIAAGLAPLIDRILRYQTTINRQLFQAVNQLERLQRLRKGENVPAPLTPQVSHDAPAISDQEAPKDKYAPANILRQSRGVSSR